MKRVFASLVGLYLLAALTTRAAEALGMRSCGCAADCWCKKPGLSAIRWAFPRGHRTAWADDARPFVK
jgi:hypothetical protein